jgi:hypothetical protein
MRYCNESCRKQFARAVQKAADLGIDAVPGARDQSQAVTPYVKAARKLAFPGLEDEIRDTLRAEVRDQVRQHLKDNILGCVEALTALLPEVLVKLGDDVQSGDWMRSSRAQSLILKYAFMFKDTEPQDGDSKVINIYHGVPVPDTPMGDRMREIVDRNIAEAEKPKEIPAILIDPDADEDAVIELPREEYERFYPECDDCGDVKPPETFAVIRKDDPGRGLCRSCYYQSEVKKRFNDPHQHTDKRGSSPLPEGPLSALESDI